MLSALGVQLDRLLCQLLCQLLWNEVTVLVTQPAAVQQWQRPLGASEYFDRALPGKNLAFLPVRPGILYEPDAIQLLIVSIKP